MNQTTARGHTYNSTNAADMSERKNCATGSTWME